MDKEPLRILVIGDIILDRYVKVKSDRQAQEASIPIWDETGCEFRLGGAANVANNVRAIYGDDAYVSLAGIYGDDYLNEIGSLLNAANIENVRFDHLGSTMCKNRYLDEKNSYIFRCDNFKKFSESDVDSFEIRMAYFFSNRDFDAVIISDYDKGTITDEIVSMCQKIPVRFVDSKRKDLRIFKGFNVLKLNEDEYSVQVSNKLYDSFERFFDFVVVTKGASGAELRQSVSKIKVKLPGSQAHIVEADDKTFITNSEDFPISSVKAVDVTGCGDTHTAAMLCSYLKTKDMRWAVKFANECAKKKVQKLGSGTVKGE